MENHQKVQETRLHQGMESRAVDRRIDSRSHVAADLAVMEGVLMAVQVQTKVEGRRGCGYRKPGGIYLVGPPWVSPAASSRSR